MKNTGGARRKKNEDKRQIKVSRIRYNVKNKEVMKYTRIYRISVPEARKKLAEAQNAVSGKTV